jgi:RNA ligase
MAKNRHANNIHIVSKIAKRVAGGERDFGRVAVKEDGDYVLLNYLASAAYSHDMTRTEEACRGLLIRTDGKIMALPFNKFYNLGERECPRLPDESYEVWEKLDGSLGIFSYDSSRFRCTTRGSFDNEYIEFAQAYWDRYVANSGLPYHFTVMVEICFDADPMPRAVYKPEGLYLIAIRDRHSGQDMSIQGMDISGLSRVTNYSYTIKNLLDYREALEGKEGWVVRFDSGIRVKIKTAWYLRLFRAMQSLTPKNIRALMVEAGENWIDEFPDDLRPDANAIQEKIEEQLRATLARIFKAYSKVAHIEGRKEYALAVMQDYADISSWLFNLRDDKFDELEVLKRLDLTV